MFVYFWIGKWSADLFDRLVEKKRIKKYNELIEDEVFLRAEKEIYDLYYEEGYNDGYNHVQENKGI